MAVGAIAVLGLIIGAAVFLLPSTTGDTTPVTLTNEQLVAAESAMTGATTAKVTVVEWGDFQCPACAAVAPMLEQIIAKYGENPEFNFVFRHFPLPLHAHARIASEAAVAAGAQGKFWEMYEALYAHINEWGTAANPRAQFESYAKTLGLDLAVFNAALDNHTYGALVDADKQAGVTLGVNRTPTIYLNGVMQNDISLAGLTKAIDDALAQ